MRIVLLALVLLLPATGTFASSHLVVKTSPYDVVTTMDRLESAVTELGATVFARVDHAKAAEVNGQVLAPNQLLIFGRPDIVTPLIQPAASMGIDMPLKVHIYKTTDGSVMVVYRDILNLAAEHNLASPAIVKAAATLDTLTTVAIAAE